MKHIFTSLFILIAAVVCAQPKLSLDTTAHDFGKFKEGAVKTFTFTVTNTGNQPLVIEKVSRPCGCTNPTFTIEPIMPGKTGKVTVAYNSENHPGLFSKMLQIKSNDPEQYHQITIMGEVIASYIPDPPAQDTVPARAE
ncbi:MAG TPA: DUF1573 domain-containing protein [Bacteroidia bacterium]|nr:DUF1573 domain-containing protein [Bacteroidia bacterium]